MGSLSLSAWMRLYCRPGSKADIAACQPRGFNNITACHFTVRLLGLPCNVKSQSHSCPVHQPHKSDVCHHIPSNNVSLQDCSVGSMQIHYVKVSFSKPLEKVSHFYDSVCCLSCDIPLQKIVMAVHIRLCCCLFIWLSPLKWLPLHPGRDYSNVIGSFFGFLKWLNFKLWYLCTYDVLGLIFLFFLFAFFSLL